MTSAIPSGAGGSVAGRAQSWDQFREDAPALTDPGPEGLSPPPPDSGTVTLLYPHLKPSLF